MERVEELSREDGRVLLDGLVSDLLGIGVGEFLARLDAGEYVGCGDEVFRLVMLAPFAR